MSATSTLKFLIVAKDEASGALKRVGGNAKETGGHVGKMSTGAKVALAGVATAAVGFGTSAVGKFKEVVGESIQLRRAMGGTIEDASRWRFAAEESGVSTETLTKSMQKLDKGLVGAGASQKTAAAMTKTLGFAFRDAHGNVLPMNELLPKLSDKFASMKNGPEKTALAMKLFGKAGSSMLPMLDKGSGALEDFRKESDKFGLTVGDKSVKELAKSRMAQREWHASMDGLKVQIGSQILPIMNKFMGFLRDYIIPVILKVTGFFQDHKSAVTVLGIAIGVLTGILAIHKIAMIATSIATKVQAVATGAWTAAQWLLNAALNANPIALIVIGIAALTAGIIWVAAKTKFFQTVWHAAWGAVKTAFSAVWNFIKDHWKLILGILTGPIGLAVLFITSHWTAIKNGFMGVVHFIGDKVGAIVGFITGIPRRIVGAVAAIGRIGSRMGSALWNGIKSVVGDIGGFGKSLYNAVAQSVNWLIDKIKNWHFTIGAFGVHHTFKPFGGIPDIPMMAKGGIVTRPTLAMIGEAGTEAVVPLNRARDFGFGGGGGGGGDVYHITVNGVIGEAKAAAKVILTELQRLKGSGVRTNLG